MKPLWVGCALIFATASLTTAADWTDQSSREQRRQERLERRRQRHHDDAHVSIGHDFRLSADDSSSGPIVVIGGSATIDGHAADDVVVIGGTARVGPTASIQGDLVSLGGHAEVDPKAQIGGEITDIGLDWPAFKWPWTSWDPGWAKTFSRTLTTVRLTATGLLAILFTFVFPSSIGRVSQRVANAPLQALFFGFGAQVLTAPLLIGVTIALVVSIVGIPLLASLPVIGVLALCVCVAGYAGVASFVGRMLRNAAPGEEPTIVDAAIGVVAIAGCTIVGEVLTTGPEWNSGLAFVVRGLGLFIEYVAWTVGLGAAIAALLARRPRTVPPPLPIPRTS